MYIIYMRRKIISHGPSSLTISLPSNWVKECNLQKGDEIDVFEDDKGLLIKPINENNEIKRKTIIINEKNQHAWKDILLALHNQGYDEIKINFDCEDITKQIHTYLNEEQLGFEIIEQSNQSTTIRNISNPPCDQFNNLFRRIFRMTNEYARKTESIMINENNITESNLLYQTTISRLSNYCRRIIIKENKKTGTFYDNIISNINNINNEFTNILEQTKEGKIISLETNKIFSKISDIITQTYNLHYQFSTEEYTRIKSSIEEMEQEIKSLKELKTEMNIINKNIKRILSSILAIQF
ncbi:phosphate uptake regulator PhoU [Candidatus Woesearchaeota archaeon]|nr:phosphate uptake regulator PhoU [Candidatus Woesearchaeota archaeon]